MPTPSPIRLSALTLDESIPTLKVYSYRVALPGSDPEDDAYKLTSAACWGLMKANKGSLIVRLSDFTVGSLTPLEALCCHTNRYGECTATSLGEVILTAESERDARIIQQIVRMDLEKACWLKANRTGQYHVQSQAGFVDIIQKTPSERIRATRLGHAYLDTLLTGQLRPSLLPDGRVIIEARVKHQLVPKSHITLQWVIDHRPEWLFHIEKVRHRYPTRGQYMTATFKGINHELTPMDEFTTGRGTFRFVDYHASNINADEKELVSSSAVVNVDYGFKDKKQVQHIAALLAPVFNFDSLAKIDSLLLNRLARDLKWPMQDRLKEAGAFTKELTLPALGRRIIATKGKNLPYSASNIRPKTFSLTFGKNVKGHSEKGLTLPNVQAYRGMQRRFVIPLMVGGAAEEFPAFQYHAQEILNYAWQWHGDHTPRPIDAQHKARMFTALDALKTHLDQMSDKLQGGLVLLGLGKGSDKFKALDMLYRYGVAVQCFSMEHGPKIYQRTYYQNTAAGLYSKGGGILASITAMPGETDMFIGLDMGGMGLRTPGSAFIFTRDGAQLGWQIVDKQQGERLHDAALRTLLMRSLDAYQQASGSLPKRMAIHRDGFFNESLDIIKEIEEETGVAIDLVEVIKRLAPPIFRASTKKSIGTGEMHTVTSNPQVGDAVFYPNTEQMLLSTYGGNELGRMAEQCTINPLKLCKRYGETSLEVLAQQILLLSRVHGASLYRHPRLPITVHHAHRFATLREQLNPDDLSRMDRFCPVYL